MAASFNHTAADDRALSLLTLLTGSRFVTERTRFPAAPNPFAVPTPTAAKESASQIVPPRVLSGIPLRISKSKIKTDGFGVFADGPLEAGDLVFCIKQPMLTIINTMEANLRSCCDHCLAVIAVKPDGSTTRTVADKDAKFMICGGCKVLCYCNKECQKVAWIHHHKYECKTYVELQKPLYNICPPESITCFDRLRFLIRIAYLKKHEKIAPPYSWDEFTGLFIRDDVASRHDGSNIFDGDLAGIVKTIYDHNKREIKVPTLHRRPVANEWIAGFFLDPFVSTIKHACDANTFYSFSGNEVQVRALRTITAGEELTFCYAADRIDQELSRLTLKEHGIPECKCKICTAGPTGPLRERVLKLESFNRNSVVDVEQGITDIKAAGFADNNHSLYRLFYTTGILYGQKADPQAIKIFLRLYYMIEPVMDPSVLPTQRIDTLTNLIELEMRLGGYSDVPGNIKWMAFRVRFHHLVQLAEMTSKWRGKDSVLTKFAVEAMEEELDEIDDAEYVYQPLTNEERRSNLLWI